MIKPLNIVLTVLVITYPWSIHSNNFVRYLQHLVLKLNSLLSLEMFIETLQVQIPAKAHAPFVSSGASILHQYYLSPMFDSHTS